MLWLTENELVSKGYLIAQQKTGDGVKWCPRLTPSWYIHKRKASSNGYILLEGSFLKSRRSFTLFGINTLIIVLPYQFLHQGGVYASEVAKPRYKECLSFPPLPTCHIQRRHHVLCIPFNHVRYSQGINLPTLKLKQLLGVWRMICKQTITGCMAHDM